MLITYTKQYLYPRRARTVSNIEFLIGFETEFVLLSSTSPVTSIHNKHAYSNSLALPTGSPVEIVLEEIVEALQISGIEVQMYHAEAGFGQVRCSQTARMDNNPLSCYSTRS
jgi:glutamine synthetase